MGIALPPWGAAVMTSPYADLPRRAFWRTGVTERPPLDPGDLYRPKFPVTRDMRIMTAGSCFAQHVGRALRGAGFNVLDTEPLPAILAKGQEEYGYNLYSARYGNIYTARQLLQLLREMAGTFHPAEPVWEKDGRFYDAQRPGVEPHGLDSAALVKAHRAAHLAAVREAVDNTELFVFTFGLTEAFIHTETDTVYPTAPGTIAGTFDPAAYSFKNFDAFEIMRDFLAVRKIFRTANPRCRFLVTVSPVPLTATASGEHVEVATVYSKSVLRAVCGMLAQRHGDIDYFPSYELITSANNRGVYFEANQRSVARQGVECAMALFMNAHGIADTPAPAAQRTAPAAKARRTEPVARTAPVAAPSEDDVQCEEALLDAFVR